MYRFSIYQGLLVLMMGVLGLMGCASTSEVQTLNSKVNLLETKNFQLQQRLEILERQLSDDRQSGLSQLFQNSTNRNPPVTDARDLEKNLELLRTLIEREGTVEDWRRLSGLHQGLLVSALVTAAKAKNLLQGTGIYSPEKLLGVELLLGKCLVERGLNTPAEAKFKPLIGACLSVMCSVVKQKPEFEMDCSY